MKFVSFVSQGRQRVGILDDTAGVVRPVAEIAAPEGLLSVIESTDALNTESELDLADVTLTAPIPRPRRDIMCVGKNYAEHAAEFARSGFDASSGGDEIPSAPIVFTKATSSVTAPESPIDAHAELTKALDYEAEIAVIIGTGGRNISRAAALDHVWGYTLINDVTARDLQLHHKQWFIGKSLDTFCPMGPWAVTADEVDPAATVLECKVNGEVRQQISFANLIFDVPTLIETLSAGITLEPGDIIATGTPSGVGIGFDPPRYLAPGDVVEVSANGLGVLRNRVTDGPNTSAI